MKAVIFANGVMENSLQMRRAAEGAELVIAADGGARHALLLGVDPGIVIGDLDSLDAADRRSLEARGSEFIEHPADKDQTDLELALLAAAAQGADEIKVVGAIGGRLDMTIANIMLLTHPELASVQIDFVHGNQTAWLARPPGGPIRGEIGNIVSLIPFGGPAQAVTSRDLQYPLEDDTLEAGPARGVSNVIVGSQPHIELHSGSLLIVITTQEMPASQERGR